MTDAVLFSDDVEPFGWSEADSAKLTYGPKGARLAILPRPWTPPFVLIPSSLFSEANGDGHELLELGDAFISRVKALAGPADHLIVRSSVIGESIWDRGSYTSEVISSLDDVGAKLVFAAGQVLKSAPGKNMGLVIQSHISPRSRGEFGNLLRVSKTRDQWELSTETAKGATSRIRFNTQRDTAASPKLGLEIKPRVVRERLFGAIAAWLNNYLLQGRSQRLNCEWVADSQQIYLVQIDEEDEDFFGINPFQLRVAAAHRPSAAKGAFLAHAEGESLQAWDKLKVLEELWEPEAPHKPTLFYVPLSALPQPGDSAARRLLSSDFQSLIGADNIVIRTSVRAGAEKLPNLGRTECVQPDQAADWCIAKRSEFSGGEFTASDMAFVAHRFVASRASAWVRAEPGNAVVEIHGLWGLPDALQYCPYDIWEVHVPTETATEYPEYKSHMLIPRDDGEWEYVRIKNELARSLSIGRREAIDIATRTASIAQRLGRSCHVMWFVGCIDLNETRFNLPWYWNEAHDAEKNIDRSTYKVFTILDHDSLEEFKEYKGTRIRQAVELKPSRPDLFRDTKFIKDVAIAVKNAGVPVILAGSTLAHAYYQLRRHGCTVVTSGEKEHLRVRRSASFGKLVRDKIPARIAQRQEAEVTRKMRSELVKGFLTGKLLEEALEVRSAEGAVQKTTELADLYEVVRALAHAEGIPLDKVITAADQKKEKAGGFEDGLVLMQTGILGRGKLNIQDASRASTQVLARKISGNSYEIPFSFFGFMEIDQPRALVFEDLGIRINILLKSDRIELSVSKGAEQLELSLDLIVEPHEESELKHDVSD